MTRIIAIAGQKGGIGKTTTTLNLGACLADLGHHVLLIDLDPQANLTRGLGVEVAKGEGTIYEVLLNTERGINTALKSQVYGDHLDLIPSSLDLAGAEVTLQNAFARETLLREALRASSSTSSYDFILIDTPPSLGLFTINSLVAADEVISPLQPQIYAWQALPMLESTINVVRKVNPVLRLSGILMTMVEQTTVLNAHVEASARETYGDLVFKAVIPANIKLSEAPGYGVPITTHAPRSKGGQAYAALALEVLTR